MKPLRFDLFLLTLLLSVSTELLAQLTSLHIEPVITHDGIVGTSDLSGLTTYRLYGTLTSPEDVISAVYGNDDLPLGISTTTDFWQSPIGSVEFATNLDPLSIIETPELAYDSWFTIGLDAQPSAENPGEAVTSIGMTNELGLFEAGNDFYINSAIGASLYVVPGASNGIAGDDLEVLLGQFTTDGQLSGTFNIQVYIGGNQLDEQLVTYSFDLESLPSVCVDPLACNYDESGLLSSDNSTCVYPEVCQHCSGEQDGTGLVITNLLSCDSILSALLFASELNPSLSDLSGYNRLIDTSDVQFVADRLGVQDGAIEILSSDGYIQIDPPILIAGDDNEEYALSTWFYIDVDTSAEYVFETGTLLSGSTAIPNVPSGYTTTFFYNSGISWYVDKWQGYTYEAINVSFGGANTSLWSEQLFEPEWNHLVVNKYADTVDFWLNGDLVSTTEGLDTTLYSAYSCSAHGYPSYYLYGDTTSCWSNDDFFVEYVGASVNSGAPVGSAGQIIDRLQIFNRSLTSAEIEVLGSASLQPVCGDSLACNYSGDLVSSTGGCTYPEEGYTCDGDCLSDYDGDGICNEFEVEGCTFSLACNYSPEATDDDGSCEFYCPGCTDEAACNYDSGAIQEDGSCQYPADLYGLDYVDCDGLCLTDTDFDGVCDEEETFGCSDEAACNYMEDATQDDGGCLIPNIALCEVCAGEVVVEADADGDGVCDADEVEGCTDEFACNFNSAATDDDGTCNYPSDLCEADYFDCSCACVNDADGDGVCDEEEIVGCQDPIACNYNAVATDPAPCETTSCAGCIYLYACNYDPDAVYSDGSCEFGTCPGCTDPLACNFNPTVSEDDDSCEYLDSCGVCGGEGPADGFYCDGTCIDSDGDTVCDFDEAGCMDEAACNYNSLVNEDDGSCTYADECIACDGECFDLNANQLCDCQETLGCLDETACNYDPLANVDSGSCLYPEPNLDCNGTCLNDADEDGLCDGLDDCPFDPQNDIDGDGICALDEIYGCTNPIACNYYSGATEDDGSCILVEEAVDSAYTQGFNDGMAAGIESIAAEEFCGEGTVWDSGFELCIPTGCLGDFNDDGVRGTDDLLQLLAVFGAPCPLVETPFTCGDAVSFDNYDYETLQIGSQCWFAENLRTTTYANGDAITGNLTNSEWTFTSSGAQAIYDNSSTNLETFGRLYNWYAVDDARGLCPSGWHVPTDGEWMTLEMELGMTSSEAISLGWRGTDQGAQMKASASDDPSWNGTNTSGFSALPGGMRNNDDGGYSHGGNSGYWWSASVSDILVYAWYRILPFGLDDVGRNRYDPRGGYSVRCLMDE